MNAPRKSERRWPASLPLVLGLLLASLTFWSIYRPVREIPPPLPPAPLDGRTELVRALSAESLFDSIENLPKFNDTVWVMGTIGGGEPKPPGTYRHEREFILRLNRVRKILAQAPEHRPAVVARLQTRLTEASQGFPAVSRAFNEPLANAERGLTLSEPDDFYRRTVVAPAAAYLLAELEAYDSLPAMSRVYAAKGLAPVNRLFLFYAMHLLAQRHPRAGLSPQAVTALDRYTAATKDLPAPFPAEVPAWDARFEETDFRVFIAHQDIGLSREPKVRLRVYPPELAKWETTGGEPSPVVHQWFGSLEAFVRAAYP